MKYRRLVALSLLMMVVSSIGRITPTDPAGSAERGQMSAVRGALGMMPPDRCR